MNQQVFPFLYSQGKFYSTKYAPPKKESKESKQLSNNIQKFLKKREAEETQRKQQEREKLNSLLAMRDEKSKNKIRKMLKVTKSANKSVLEDAKDCDNTSVSLGGPEGDDYGYVSTEANAFYQKYIEKVKDVQEDKGFAPSRPQSLRDLSGTKERVKAAITREREEAKTHTRQRISHAAAGATSSGSRSHRSDSTGVARAYNTSSSSSKTLYDPEAEERKKREEESIQKAKAKAKRPPQPPPLDFQALLRLAEKKQHEPVAIATPDRKKEPERLLSAREKREQEERQRWKEQRAQRDRMREMEAAKPKEQQRKESSSSGAAAMRMEPNSRIPKLNKTSNATTTPTPTTSTAKSSSATSDSHKRPAAAATAPSAKLSASTKPATNGSSSSSSKRPPGSSSTAASSSSSTKATASSSAKPAAAAAAAPQSRNPYAAANKAGATREFPPREFPPRDIIKTRTMPQLEVQRRRQQTEARAGRAGPPPGAAARPRQPEKSECAKQIKVDLVTFKLSFSCPFLLLPRAERIYDEDDSEYDSELDDFIDDGGCEEDISSHIRDIFGYDKRRYRDLDEDDDRMESSYAQMQREEFISKKLGELWLPHCLPRSRLTCSLLVQVYKRIWRTCAWRRCIKSERWSRNAPNHSTTTTMMTRAAGSRHVHILVSQSVSHGFHHTKNFPIYLTDSSE